MEGWRRPTARSSAASLGTPWRKAPRGKRWWSQSRACRPFREEAELDLFAEQVVWAGFVAWLRECFALGVEQGFSPELLVLELYASNEASEIFGLMAKHGFFKQMAHHSTTSQYGTLSRAPQVLNDEVRARMRECLVNDIKGGAFAKEWSSEQAGGSKDLAKLKDEAFASAMAKAEEKVIELVQQAHSV